VAADTAKAAPPRRGARSLAAASSTPCQPGRIAPDRPSSGVTASTRRRRTPASPWPSTARRASTEPGGPGAGVGDVAQGVRVDEIAHTVGRTPPASTASLRAPAPTRSPANAPRHPPNPARRRPRLTGKRIRRTHRSKHLKRTGRCTPSTTPAHAAPRLPRGSDRAYVSIPRGAVALGVERAPPGRWPTSSRKARRPRSRRSGSPRAVPPS
jgi:hypothetical protein